MTFKPREIPVIAMLTALTVALSLVFIIPIPATKGFVTLCEVGIYTTAILLKNPGGLAVGALSGLLIDLLSGYPEWCLFSLMIHGTQGWLVGYLTSRKYHISIGLALLGGSLVMIFGYLLATTFLFGWGAGVASIIGNLFQNGFGIAITIPLVASLHKVRPQLFNI